MGSPNRHEKGVTLIASIKLLGVTNTSILMKDPEVWRHLFRTHNLKGETQSNLPNSSLEIGSRNCDIPETQKEGKDCTPSHCVADFKVMSLNVWGLPEFIGSKDKTARMKGIAKMMEKADFDVYLFQELWQRYDYRIIKNRLPKGYRILGYKKLQGCLCDGVIAPTGCSGLTIVSKHPIVDHQFQKWNKCFSWQHPEECAVCKGFGRVRLNVDAGFNISVDVYNLHAAAWDENIDIRRSQIRQLMSDVKKSTADIQIVGGDFNQHPNKEKDNPYQIVTRSLMKDSAEVNGDPTQQGVKWMTYANRRNSYSGHGTDRPEILDYIFYRTTGKRVEVTTNWYILPFCKTMINGIAKSLSDHEAVAASFTITKQNV